MALVITRVDDTLFEFQLDGGDIRTDDKPRLTTFNNLCDFKTANGANLYQRIALNTIMVVDTFGGSGTFTFISVLELRQKLKELKFFEGANGNGAGSGVDRFDNLLDAFQYFENAGKVAIVNPSETALIASDFYNINRSTQLVDFPSTLIAGKWLQVADDGLSFTFIDPIEQPEPYVNAVGWVIYDNNEASPISYVSGLEQLTNDTAGIDTNVDNLPFGVSDLWDNGLNELDFSQLSLNDMVDLSLNTTVTTNSINQNCKIYLKVAIGSASEKTILLNDLTFATVDTYEILSRLNFAIINSDYKDFPSQILFESNDTADVYLENIYISTTRKDANYAILYAVDSTSSHNKGNYNVTTNTPTLSNGSGQIGDYYTLTNAGTRDFGAGNITFGIGDRIEYNGGIWFKAIDNSQGMGALDNTADHDKGDYNATTNTPTLIDGTGQIGDYYKVSVAGTVDLGSGNIILQIDDIIGYDGSIWYKKVNNNQSGGGVTSIDTLNGVQTLGGITASLTEKVTIVDNDLIGGADSEASNASKKWKFSTMATYVLSKLGATLWALTAKTTPVNADTITINDTADSNNLKKVTLTNLWNNYFKSKADALYQAILVSGTNIKTINGNSILGSGDLTISYLELNNHINYTIGTGGTGRVNVGHASTGIFNAGTQTGGKTDYGITLIKNTTSAVLGSQANYNQLIPNIIITGFSKIKLIHQSFFGIASATTPTSSRCLNGYTLVSLKNMGNIEPSTAAVFAFCNDSADTNLQLAWINLSNIVTKIDLGSNFPARYADGEHFYKCIFKFLGNNQAIAYIKDIETGLSWNSGVISGVERIEPNGVHYVNHINNNTTAEAVDIYWFGQITKYTYDI